MEGVSYFTTMRGTVARGASDGCTIYGLPCFGFLSLAPGGLRRFGKKGRRQMLRIYSDVLDWLEMLERLEAADRAA